ncbi:MAG: hypothetical protein H6813_07455 [Phycisphaeraceae bacterium]|nr:hypothetical protein [Phycisphaeraceae bacterium]MCB9848331.1 hypothetical protein [Phycisphaeraceae bacterium]
MNRSLRLFSIAFVLALLGVSIADAGTGVLRLRERLAALAPSDPVAYYELAEEVAYEQPEAVELARTLYVLSFEIARRGDPASPLGPSVCLALADLSTSSLERRWLRSLARSLAGGGGALLPIAPEDEDTSPAVALAVAGALGDFRSGEYRGALDAIEKDDRVREVFERQTRSFTGGASRIEDELQSEPQCRRCRNRRIVRAGEPDSYMLCPICGGNPGPKLSDAELIDLLRIESTLLGGASSTWSAQLVLDEGRPLRDIDPDELAPWFGVDPEATVWDAQAKCWASPGVVTTPRQLQPQQAP